MKLTILIFSRTRACSISSLFNVTSEKLRNIRKRNNVHGLAQNFFSTTNFIFEYGKADYLKLGETQQENCREITKSQKTGKL